GLDPRLLDRELHRLGAGAGIVSYAEDDALQLIGACLDAGVDHLADPRKLDDLDADDVACPVTDDPRLLRLAALRVRLISVDRIQRQILGPERLVRHADPAHP